jgi:hypothetical protein
MSQYNLADVNNQLQQEAGRIGEMISSKLIATDPWNRLVKQDTFPAGMGESIQTLIQERTTVPNASSTAWEDVGTNDGTGNTCNPTPQVVEFARTLKSYNLQQSAIRSPGFCVNDLRTAWKAEEQLAGEVKVLKENSQWFWSNRYRDEFSRLSGNKVVTDVNDTLAMSTSGSNQAFPAAAPAYALDQGILDQFYLDLSRDAAEGNYAIVDGEPQYALICSPETSNYLKKQNADIRQDLRFSSQVDELIKPFGAAFSYSGFVHLVDRQAPRYTFTGGQFVRVPFFTTAPAGTGLKAVVNPAYRTAPYEVSFIYNPHVYTSRVAQVITSPGSGLKFDPVNYRGEFMWINNKDNANNILGVNGYFYALFMQGSQPKRTEWGYAIMHLRCGPATLYQSCS